MKLYIKNMVCARCNSLVKEVLDNTSITYLSINLGEVETTGEISLAQRTDLSNALLLSGFELIDPQKNEIFEKLKNAIHDLEGFSNEALETSYSDYISMYMDDNFISLNTLFSEIEGITIDKYIIRQKIERVKELLVYDDMSIAEITYRLRYSDISELSKQFKSITGLTPGHFRDLRQARKKSIEFPDIIQ